MALPSTPTQSTDAIYISPFTSPPAANLPKPSLSRTLSLKSSNSSLRKSNRHHHRHPRSPLPPHRLAKLANALGVSTPLPAFSPLTPQTSRSVSTPTATSRQLTASPVDFRSASPASSTSLRPPSSRFLLHVIPPVHFPHESEDDQDEYATFRRGTLVPLHPTLQTQLGAIAREFAMPSSQGMMLYLISGSGEDVAHDGPRITEEVWRWLWMRVLDDQQTHRGVGLGLGISSSSAPSSPEGYGQLRKLSSSSMLETPSHADWPSTARSYPLTPSPSTPSESSSIAAPRHPPRPPNPQPNPQRGHNGQQRSQSTDTDHDTPTVSSLDLDVRLLPGLDSPSLIPVLAKVEFDIERKGGGWYETWSRSRRDMWERQRKRAEGESEGIRKLELQAAKGPSWLSESAKAEAATDELEGAVESGYTPLDDAPDEGQDDDGTHEREDELDDDPTARVSNLDADPLADVFGHDDAAWSDLKSSRPDRFNDLALDGAVLGSSIEVKEGSITDGKLEGKEDTEEVMDLWNAHDRPQLNINIPSEPNSPHTVTSSPNLNDASRRLRRNVPPPLTFVPKSGVPNKLPTVSPSTQGSDGSNPNGNTGLAYLDDGTVLKDNGSQEPNAKTQRGDTDDIDYDDPPRTSIEEKREGAIFDDIDLDLDLSILTSEYDTDEPTTDPNDRRLSQLRMQRELDVLERNLAAFSPRDLSHSLALPTDMFQSALRSAPPTSLHFFGQPREGGLARSASARTGSRESSPIIPSLVPSVQLLPPVKPSVEIEEDVTITPPVFRQPVLVGTPSPIADSFVHYDRDSRASTSANAYQPGYVGGHATSISTTAEDEQARRPPKSPPRLALNGATRISIPAQKRKQSVSSASNLTLSAQPSMETVGGNEEDTPVSSTTLTPSLARNREEVVSPIIPLSPDPFGRYSSHEVSIASAEEQQRQSVAFSLSGERTSASFSNPPQRKSSLAGLSQRADTPGSSSHGHDGGNSSISGTSIFRRNSQTQSSRFSNDSMMEELGRGGKDRSTIMSVKSLRKLWRKSNKGSTSSIPPPTPIASTSSRPSPPRGSSILQQQQQPPQLPYPSIPEAENERSREPSPVPPRPPSKSPKLQNQSPVSVPRRERDSGALDPFYFDQDSRYPVRRSPSPSQGSFSMSQSQAPSPSTVQPPSRSGTPHSTSILGQPASSYRSSSPSPPPATMRQPTPPVTEPKEPKERGSVRKSILKWKNAASNITNSSGESTTPRKRRPSVLDVASNIMRSGSASGSAGSSGPESAVSPAVPEIPAAYRFQHSSHLYANAGRTPAHSPQPPPERRSGDTVSQFEIVSPRVNESLSYPYTGLDGHDGDD
ncbi:hypothetical protein BD410DRAFT_346342 [Rickenella mellea]|uniref:Uncharacterized protein n=1 Tax=Rickenella mellea TaxID=50990 RepID=A0A4Y7QMJ4_9AGAM|nr:hypothetical protein BD410DRAFT_346342 [Rickenella mellea]